MGTKNKTGMLNQKSIKNQSKINKINRKNPQKNNGTDKKDLKND
jgi:hypothetical protein